MFPKKILVVRPKTVTRRKKRRRKRKAMAKLFAFRPTAKTRIPIVKLFTLKGNPAIKNSNYKTFCVTRKHSYLNDRIYNTLVATILA